MIFILPITVIAITTIANRFITKSWLAPGTFFSTFWLLMIILPMVLASEYYVSLIGVWYIVILNMAICSGAIIAYKPKSAMYNKLRFNNNSLTEGFILLLILINIALFGIIVLIKFVLSNYQFNNIDTSFLLIPNLISIDRYAGIINYPAIIKYSLYCIYPASLIGGFVFGIRHNQNIQRLISLLPILIALILGVIEGSRSNVMLSIILFFSAWCTTLVYNNNQERKNKLKIVLGIIFIVFGFTGIFIFIQWLRQGMDTLVADLLVQRIRAYYFGYLSAFTQWFEYNREFVFYGGINTFAGPGNLLGLVDRSFGFYEPINISVGLSTNIYTALRGLIVDFTSFGALIICFIIGYFSQKIYNYVNGGMLMGLIPLSIFYAFTIYSPIISIFHYNSIISSWIIVSIPFILSRK